MVRLPTGRLGVRNRVVLFCGLLAFGISAVFAVVAWRVSSDYMVDSRDANVLADAAENARAIEQYLARGDTPVRAIDALPNRPESTGSVLYLGGDEVEVPTNLLKSELPPGYTKAVRDGTAQTAELEVAGERFVVAGIPLSQPGDGYFELFALSDVETSNASVAVTLVGAVALTTVMGLLFGQVASRRALQPLADVTVAAAAITRGETRERLDRVTDPDLSGLARLFDQTAASLRRQEASEARFAGDVSHELRSPLTTMLNSMQLLKNRRPMLPEVVREPVDLLGDELDRFRKLVIDLLEISRSSGADTLDVEDIRISELVRRTADMTAGRAVTAVGPVADNLSLRVDVRRVERVVANLVENAEIHGHGCESVRVLRNDNAGGRPCVWIVVDDRGPGVPAALRQRIFERFARDMSGDVPGVGLGLAIVMRHVEFHQGQVWVEDRPDGGSRFVVELPRRARFPASGT